MIFNKKTLVFIVNELGILYNLLYVEKTRVGLPLLGFCDKIDLLKSFIIIEAIAWKKS